MDEIGDVVFLAVVPLGHVLEWVPGESKPEHSAWVSGEAFTLMQRAFSVSRTPVLSRLDVYSETRIAPEDCRHILAAWADLQERLSGTVAEAPTRELERLLHVCAATPGTELLIEGP